MNPHIIAFELLELTGSTINTSFGNIDRESFEQWLRVNDKLNWSEDTSNYRGEHDQHLGRFTIGEYWSTPYVNTDLQEYIKVTNKTGKLATLPDKAAMLKKLLDAMNNPQPPHESLIKIHPTAIVQNGKDESVALQYLPIESIEKLLDADRK